MIPWADWLLFWEELKRYLTALNLWKLAWSHTLFGLMLGKPRVFPMLLCLACVRLEIVSPSCGQKLWSLLWFHVAAFLSGFLEPEEHMWGWDVGQGYYTQTLGLLFCGVLHLGFFSWFQPLWHPQTWFSVASSQDDCSFCVSSRPILPRDQPGSSLNEKVI